MGTQSIEAVTYCQSEMIKLLHDTFSSKFISETSHKKYDARMQTILNTVHNNTKLEYCSKIYTILARQSDLIKLFKEIENDVDLPYIVRDTIKDELSSIVARRKLYFSDSNVSAQ